MSNIASIGDNNDNTIAIGKIPHAIKKCGDNRDLDSLHQIELQVRHQIEDGLIGTMEGIQHLSMIENTLEIIRNEKILTRFLDSSILVGKQDN